jgi:glycosyltransferase involved in cell wall biosynthesis
LRQQEQKYGRAAQYCLLTTEQERAVFNAFTPDADVRVMNNGVDFDYYDPSRVAPLAELERRRFVVFVGVMNYFPNVEAVTWFAVDVLPTLRARDPDLEFYIVGRNPTTAVRRLARLPGVIVTGGVADVRPYLFSAEAVVAPFQIARGMQNKVLEGLAMGKRVFASKAIANTFGEVLPCGISVCESAEAWVGEILGCPGNARADLQIREAAREHFTWADKLQVLRSCLQSICGGNRNAA